MKYLLLFIFFLFVSCKNENSDVLEYDISDYFNVTFELDDDSCLCLKDSKPIDIYKVQDELVGYGWLHLGTYAIRAGKLEKGLFSPSLYDVNYYFESKDSVVEYYHGEENFGTKYSKTTWLYNNMLGYVYVNSNPKIPKKYVYMQILQFVSNSTSEQHSVYMYVVHQIGIRSGGEDIYGLSVFRRMSIKELELVKSSL